MSAEREQKAAEKEYRIRAVHRDVPDPERLIALIVNLTTGRRDQIRNERSGGEQEDLPGPDRFR